MNNGDTCAPFSKIARVPAGKEFFCQKGEGWGTFPGFLLISRLQDFFFHPKKGVARLRFTPSHASGQGTPMFCYLWKHERATRRGERSSKNTRICDKWWPKETKRERRVRSRLLYQDGRFGNTGDPAAFLLSPGGAWKKKKKRYLEKKDTLAASFSTY